MWGKNLGKGGDDRGFVWKEGESFHDRGDGTNRAGGVKAIHTVRRMAWARYFGRVWRRGDAVACRGEKRISQE